MKETSASCESIKERIQAAKSGVGSGTRIFMMAVSETVRNTTRRFSDIHG
jgi:hypothetical protein